MGEDYNADGQFLIKVKLEEENEISLENKYSLKDPLYVKSKYAIDDYVTTIDDNDNLVFDIDN